MNNDILKIKNMLELNHSNAINIEKFMTIIRGDIKLGLSLLALFKQQSYEYLDNLQYALANSDKNSQKLFEAAHAIKGASLSIAAEKITLLATNIENQIRDKQTIEPDNYHQLVNATQELLNYITMIETRQAL
jgi:HPt (histidine-containing phosphotransfer) domain-containing protein